MTHRSFTILCGLAPALLSLIAERGFAQEGETPTSQPQETPAPAMSRDDALVLAKKSWSKMLSLQGIEFSTAEGQNDSMTRKFGRMMGGGDTEVDGKWTPNSLHAHLGDDDEIVLHGGRMIARDDDSDWVLRHNCLASGDDLPFLFDPGRFFEILSTVDQQDLAVTRHVVEEKGEQKLLVISYTAEDDGADELLLAGGMPRVKGMGSMIMIGGLGGMPRPETEIDFSLSIDLESHLVHAVHVKAYQTNAMGGMVTVQGAGMNEEEEDDEPVRTKDEHGNRIYKKGLPVREVEDDESTLTFEVQLKNHDMPMRPELDDAARKLLRMR